MKTVSGGLGTHSTTTGQMSRSVPMGRLRTLETGANGEHHVRTPGNKSEYNDGSAGWSVEKGMVPKPLGGAYVSLRVLQHGNARRIRCQIGVQPIVHDPAVMVG
jgi:hypothetical protein